MYILCLLTIQQLYFLGYAQRYFDYICNEQELGKKNI